MGVSDNSSNSMRLTGRLTRWLTGGTDVSQRLAALRHRVFPTHWTAMLGQVVVFSFLIVVVSGFFLALFYVPSSEPVVYDGAYGPLRGAEMSQALRSTLDISFEVRGGLLVRQIHNWASSLMIAALMLHLARMFFTGAFRAPREPVWLLLIGVLLVSMAAGFTGMALPDDLLSGSSLMILNGVLLSIPFVGTQLSSFVFRGPFPGDPLPAFSLVHGTVLPIILAGLLLAVAALALARKPAQFPRAGRSNSNVVGRPLKAAVTRSAGLLFLVIGVVAALGAAVQVNPVWLYGAADPGSATAGAGPVWYLAVADGALRLVPPGWEFEWLGGTVTLAVLVPVAAVGLWFAALAGYPFLERWLTGDATQHHLLDRPRTNAGRTAIGAAGVTVYAVLWAAAGSDTIATQFHLTVESVVLTLQIALFLAPVLAASLARRICIGLQRKDLELLQHGVETGRIVRYPGGEYVEVHRQLDDEARAAIASAVPVPVVTVRPDARGRIPALRPVQALASRWFTRGNVAMSVRKTEELEVSR